jgi:uncharacterized membrane protein YjgN (DUF898 family)
VKEGIAPGTPGPRAHAAFTGENGEFRRLVTRGALLELVTFGFYRFWLATNIRRHLWSNSSVAGDALEYTGTGRELLIGFLFALAILVPIYLEKAADPTPTGEPLLSFGEWRALKAICK